MKVDLQIETDVLVIGSGAAGVRAAVAAYDHGAKTTVVLKGGKGKSGATVSPDSSAVAWQAADDCSSSDDNPEAHYQNIVDAGLGMADPALARILAFEILERMAELEEWGLQFIPDPEGKKRHYAGYSCFADKPRAHGIANSGFGHAGDIIMVLLEQINRREIDVHEDIFITDLIVDNNQCLGALALGPDGQVIVFWAGAVVLVTGGARQLFPIPPGRAKIDTTGDGYAMAFRAGAELANMEFGQYVINPVKPFPVQVPGSFWKLFPRVRDKDGRDALKSFLPANVTPDQVMTERTLHYPFSTRDTSKWLDIAFVTEIREGRGTNDGCLYLDFSQVDFNKFVPSRPQHIPQDNSLPVKLPEEWMKARPHAHAINGGILINEEAESSLRGLFSAGEASAGPHGADRLGGGMVTNCQVFGARAGRFAAKFALGVNKKKKNKSLLEKPLQLLNKFKNGIKNPADLLKILQASTAKNIMVVKNETGLKKLITTIQKLKHEDILNIKVNDVLSRRQAIEIENLLITAELMAKAALLRTESRGSHYREDFPAKDEDNWRQSIILCNENGSIRSRKKSLEKG